MSPALHNFFINWQLWQQMTFTLGSSIVLVLACAFGVRLVRHRRTKRLQAQNPAANAERGETEQEIPFGVRVIEKGLEVDGVWNSRTTTPLHSPVPSPRTSSPSRSFNKLSKSRRDLSISSISVLDMPQSAHVKGDPPQASARPPSHLKIMEYCEPQRSTSIVSQTKTLDGQVETERLAPLVPTKHTRPSMTITYSRPRTLLDWPTNTAVGSHGLTAKNRPTTELFERPRQASTAKENFRHHTVIIGGFHGAARFSSPQPSSAQNCELFHHFQTHVPEPGQVLLRARRRSGGDYAIGSTPSRSESELGTISTRSTSWPLKHGGIVLASVPNTRISTSSHHAITYRAFVEGHPPPIDTPPSAWSTRTQKRMEEKLAWSQRKAKAPLTPKASDTMSYQNTTTRKVNDAFEVLPAGALDKPSPVKEFGFWPEQRSSSTDEPRGPRKLQKRNRSSSSGRTHSWSSRSSTSEAPSLRGRSVGTDTEERDDMHR